MSENTDLNQMLFKKETKGDQLKVKKMLAYKDAPQVDYGALDSENVFLKSFVQWTTSDNVNFIPAAKTAAKLIPGVYEINSSPSIGTYFQRIPIKNEGLVRFPDTNSDAVLKEIQKFWEREDVFKSYGLTYKRGILLYGPPGCHARGTKVIMADGTTKSVENVQIGDSLMNINSGFNKVLELKRGRELMYKITPENGEPFEVNASHILHLEGERKSTDITVREYLTKSDDWKSYYKLARKTIDYKNCSGTTPIDPYILGVWLARGCEDSAIFKFEEKEILDRVKQYAQQNDLFVKEKPLIVEGEKKINFVFVSSDNGKNKLFSALNELNLINSKHIPHDFLISSKTTRMQLLAGILDAGAKVKDGCFKLKVKEQLLAENIMQVARSLGLQVSIKMSFGTSYKLTISGPLGMLPMRVDKKKINSNQYNLHTKIKKIEALEVDDFYGFTLSGDNLYLTKDFIVHHNSGKSCTIQLIMEDVVKRGGIIIKFINPHLFIDGMRIIRQIQPNIPIVTIMEDVDSILEIYNESEILNILDGVEEVRKTVFLATTNYPENLGARIVNRPSRFDKRFRIGYPSDVSRRMYFAHLLKGVDQKKLGINIDQWVEDTDKMSIAHLKELFVQVVILGDKYKDSIQILKGMKETLEDKEYETSMGFGPKQKSENFYN